MALGVRIPFPVPCVLVCSAVFPCSPCWVWHPGGRSFLRSAKCCVSVCLDPPPCFLVGCCYVAGFAGEFNM